MPPAAAPSRRATLFIAFVTIVALVFMLVWSKDAKAVEGGMSPYLKGSAGFMSGFLPPQGGLIVINPFYYHFNGSAGTEVRNGNVEVGIDVKIDAPLLQGVYTTSFKPFGATYAFGAVIGWVWADISATVQAPAGNVALSQDTNGFGDSLVMPIILGWHSGDLHMIASLPVYIPTGAYTTGHLSVSKNVWGLMPTLALTWFNPMSGWDLSGSTTFVFLTNNNATDYQSGVLWHLDWAIGKHLGKWELGVAGNFVEQITGDSGSGAKLGDFKAHSIGIGPAINYNAMIGPAPLIFSAKWEPDVSASKTFKGDVIMVSLSLIL